MQVPPFSLSQQLADLGHSFRTSRDTEVLVAGYRALRRLHAADHAATLQPRLSAAEATLDKALERTRAELFPAPSPTPPGCGGALTATRCAPRSSLAWLRSRGCRPCRRRSAERSLQLVCVITSGLWSG